MFYKTTNVDINPISSQNHHHYPPPLDDIFGNEQPSSTTDRPFRVDRYYLARIILDHLHHIQ